MRAWKLERNVVQLNPNLRSVQSRAAGSIHASAGRELSECLGDPSNKVPSDGAQLWILLTLHGSFLLLRLSGKRSRFPSSALKNMIADVYLIYPMQRG